jgi:catechol 2,3-dioxygenase-like lactoylglutathione lyase family enzyme
VLHHVSLEVLPDDVERTVELFVLLGFERVPAPDPIAEYVTWVERGGTQIHLVRTPEPTVPALGHAGVVAPEFDPALDRLRGAGFEVEESRELWGERRAFATLPGGGRIEVMAEPPPASG